MIPQHESGFPLLLFKVNKSVMLSSLEGVNLGVWIFPWGGEINLPLSQDNINIVANYGYGRVSAILTALILIPPCLCDTHRETFGAMPH